LSICFGNDPCDPASLTRLIDHRCLRSHWDWPALQENLPAHPWRLFRAKSPLAFGNVACAISKSGHIAAADSARATNARRCISNSRFCSRSTCIDTASNVRTLKSDALKNTLVIASLGRWTGLDKFCGVVHHRYTAQALTTTRRLRWPGPLCPCSSQPEAVNCFRHARSRSSARCVRRGRQSCVRRSTVPARLDGHCPNGAKPRHTAP
jgi:hypothetical protein